MNFIMKTLPFLASTLIISFLTTVNAATFNIVNRCSYTVWAAAKPGGGKRLDSGTYWQINVTPGSVEAQIWARTKCNFDGSGRDQCETGDCGGVLEGYGEAPNTLAKFSLNQLDSMYISLEDGFNVPMEFSPTTNVCRNIKCTGPINDECPTKLRALGGCNNPCTVFKTNEYCCMEGPGSCRPTDILRFFKDKCPDAYTYPQDDLTSIITCPPGTNYRVVFCP